jgi:hypothetical protein
MTVEIGTEAAQFPEKEYINGIFVAVRNTLGGVSLWYRTDCAGCPFSCNGPARCPAVKSGELQAAGNSICLCLTECSYDPPEGNPGQLAYAFGIRLLSTSRT